MGLPDLLNNATIVLLSRMKISKHLLKYDYIVIMLSASRHVVLFCILLCFTLTMVINQCLGVDHDEILLLFSPFPIIPIVGTNCYYTVIFFYIVLCWWKYTIFHFIILLYLLLNCIVSYYIVFVFI